MVAVEASDRHIAALDLKFAYAGRGRRQDVMLAQFGGRLRFGQAVGEHATVPQQFADEVDVGLVDVEIVYPANP